MNQLTKYQFIFGWDYLKGDETLPKKQIDHCDKLAHLACRASLLQLGASQTCASILCIVAS